METARRLAAIVGLLAGVLALPAQEEEGRTYFSLQTEGPVAPGTAAKVRVRSQAVDRLEFRLYRVNDPVEFLRRLDDPHRFGGTVRRPEPKRTPIERFAAWKRSLRAGLRDLVRRQFSSENRAILRAAITGKPALPRPKQYAGVAVLNPQQLVRSWSQVVKMPNRWDAATVPVDTPGKGLYVIEATDGKLRAFSLISVTELAVVAKAMPGRVVVRAVDWRNGAPVPDCPVHFLPGGGKPEFTQGRTDRNGIFELESKQMPPDGFTVAARRGEDTALAAVPAYSLATEGFRNVSGYVYTDRPVYRPGHPVHFKAILRTTAGIDYALPDNKSVQVEIEDPEGKPLEKKTVSVSGFGTVSGDLKLADDAALGYYSVAVNLGGEGEHDAKVYGGFHVEEYRKPEFEVRVKPETARAEQGRTIRLDITARYYYGEPVRGGSVSYTVHRQRAWLPWFDEDFGEEFEDAGYGGGEQVEEKSGRLDADGKFSVEIRTEATPEDMRYRVEAKVTDSANREAAGGGGWLATRGPFFLTIHPERYVYNPGQEVRLTVESRDYEGNPAGSQAFEASVVTQGSKEKPERTVFTQAGRTGAGGQATLTLPAPEAGAYQVHVKWRTPAGAEARESAWLWVSGSWSVDEGREQRLKVILDRKSYKPGETAKALIVTSGDCDLWVTLEGRTVHWSKFVRAVGGTATVEFPIVETYTPTVFVEAVAVRDGRVLRGTKAVNVPPDQRKINVELKSGKPEYRPGEPAVLSLTARDAGGKPVEAEFSVGVVDEAIYAVKNEAQPDILKAFYGRTWNRVGTDTSLQYYFYGESGRRALQLAQLKPRETYGQVKPERPTGVKVRKAFPDTAYWIADLKTGSSGQAKVEFAYPDSLTTWRATARGVTRDTKVGSAVERAIVRKNVLVTMGAPRFFTAGDEIVIPVVARNSLDRAQSATVTLEGQGIEILGGGPAEVKLDPKGEARVDYRVRAGSGDKAVLTAKVVAPDESDALELTLPVEPYGLRVTHPEQKTLQAAEDRAEFAFTLPEGARQANVSVHLTPSVAGAVFAALDYLLTYPYGCTEQTMSSFLPNVVVAQALKELKVSGGVDQRELNKKVKAGLERLYGYQHDDGGWGWWKSDDSDAFMTAYVASGLKLAEQAGYQVESYRFTHAAQWLGKELAAGRVKNPDTKAYAAHALISLGFSAGPVLDALWEDRARLSPFGLAVLGLALDEKKDARAGQAADDLEARAEKDGAWVKWVSRRDPMLDFEIDNSFEATAFAVRFLARRRPSSPLLDPAARWLVEHRDEGYYWNSTKRTAFVIYGLTGWLKQSGELSADYQVRVSLDGREVLSRRLSAEDAMKEKPLAVAVPLGDGGTHNVTVEKRGEGRLYAGVRWTHRATAGLDQGGASPESNRLRVTREYFRLVPETTAGRIVYALEPLSGPARPGDVLAVRLTLRGDSGPLYMVVEDPIPSGAEPVVRDDLYEIRGAPPWWRNWADRREQRDNRVSFFPRVVPQQGLDYVYLLRITNGGQFRITPARAERMYESGVAAWSEARILEVKP